MNDTPGQPTTARLAGLNHLRTLAITLVLLFHYGRLFPHPEWTNTISKFGWTGVDLFFVLSGYLIAAQLFAEIKISGRISLSTFFQKRFFRIIPAYAVVVAIYFCFPYVHEREALPPLWKFLTFTQNIGLNLRTQGTFSHAWSLCIEEQFYLALPLILSALIYFKALTKGGLYLLFLFLFGIGIRWYLYQYFVLPHVDDFAIAWYCSIYYPTYCRLDGLLVGVGIAALFQYKPWVKERLSTYKNLLLFLSLLVLAGAYFLCLDEESFAASVFGFPLISIGYGCMVMSAILPGSFLYRSASRVTASIATLSYAIYLVHKFVIHIVQAQLAKINIAPDSNLALLLCTLAVLVAAFIMNKAIEKPFLKLRTRLARIK